PEHAAHRPTTVAPMVRNSEGVSTHASAGELQPHTSDGADQRRQRAPQRVALSDCSPRASASPRSGADDSNIIRIPERGLKPATTCPESVGNLVGWQVRLRFDAGHWAPPGHWALVGYWTFAIAQDFRDYRLTSYSLRCSDFCGLHGFSS